MAICCISLGVYAGALILAPLLLGIIPRVKAWFAGRQGQPLLQIYYDLIKLSQKGAVYSTTTTWVFRLGPMVCLASMLTAFLMLPMFGISAPLQFHGDLLLFAYFFALIRFFMIVAAMDTGSSFEGMGASREAVISMLTEPSFFLVLATLVKHNNSFSLSEIFNSASPNWSLLPGPVLALSGISLLIVILVENYRVPVDDPTTHLELTMIHEVMVLDNSGPDFGFIMYTSCLKMWITTSLLAQMLIPAMPTYPVWSRPLAIFGTMIGLVMLIGVIESVMARLRLVRIPSLLVGITTASLLGFLLLK